MAPSPLKPNEIKDQWIGPCGAAGNGNRLALYGKFDLETQRAAIAGDDLSLRGELRALRLESWSSAIVHLTRKRFGSFLVSAGFRIP